MRRRHLEILQWAGLFVGAATFAAAHVLGYGTVLATCNPGNAQFGIDHHVWEGALLSSSAVVVLLAEAASVAVLLATRDTSYEAEPPLSRIRFFAITAATANILFLGIVLLDLFGSLFNVPCRQA
ncbi:MAG TPA: hypothetical protein VFA19_15475 [Gaiellaceae bacterium]|nr:hypothetical protein [Gaiellaceae bacterium]